jgi:hypothetical protein
MLGELDELSRLVPALVDEARERGNRHVETAMSLFGGPLCALAADRPARARACIDAALARWPRRPGSFQHFREVIGQARIAIYEGDGRGAHALLTEAWPAFYRSGLLFSPLMSAELRLVGALAALTAGDVAAAERAAFLLSRSRVVWASNSSMLIRGSLARKAGDLAGGLAQLERAEGRARKNGLALVVAAIRRRRGEWIGQDRGRALIADADAWMRGKGVVDPARMTAMLLGQ